MEAKSAVVNESIEKPGTNFAVPQRSTTLIKSAPTPKVRRVIGSAISCKIGLIKVFTTPITTAVTTAAQRFDKVNPGTRYSTIRSANTLTKSFPKISIDYSVSFLVKKSRLLAIAWFQ